MKNINYYIIWFIVSNVYNIPLDSSYIQNSSLQVEEVNDKKTYITLQNNDTFNGYCAYFTDNVKADFEDTFCSTFAKFICNKGI